MRILIADTFLLRLAVRITYDLKYVSKLDAPNVETFVTSRVLMLKTPFELCLKRFDKENLNLNKIFKIPEVTGFPRAVKQILFSPKGLICDAQNFEFIT